MKSNGKCRLQLLTLGLPIRQLSPMISRMCTWCVSLSSKASAIQAIKAGADNCLEKPVDAEQLCSEIQALLDQAAPSPSCPVGTLTPMEKTVLHLILEGKTNHETAKVLHRSPRTIEVHRRHIMHKLGISNIVELVRKASTMGLSDATGR